MYKVTLPARYHVESLGCHKVTDFNRAWGEEGRPVQGGLHIQGDGYLKLAVRVSSKNFSVFSFVLKFGFSIMYKKHYDSFAVSVISLITMRFRKFPTRHVQRRDPLKQ